MLSSGQLLTILIFLGILFLLMMAMILYCQKLMNQSHRQEIKTLNSLNQQKLTTINNLLDRLMSQDAKTYSLMSQVTSRQMEEMTLTSALSEEYTSMSDANEIKNTVNADGIGEALYDEEYVDFIQSINRPRG